MTTLKEQYLADSKEIESAQVIFHRHVQQFNSIKLPIEHKRIKLQDRFAEIINNEIKHNHTCKCCQPRYFDDVWVHEDGISGRIEADHPNDIIERDWTWEEVEQIFKLMGEPK